MQINNKDYQPAFSGFRWQIEKTAEGKRSVKEAISKRMPAGQHVG